MQLGVFVCDLHRLFQVGSSAAEARFDIVLALHSPGLAPVAGGRGTVALNEVQRPSVSRAEPITGGDEGRVTFALAFWHAQHAMGTADRLRRGNGLGFGAGTDSGLGAAGSRRRSLKGTPGSQSAMSESSEARFRCLSMAASSLENVGGAASSKVARLFTVFDSDGLSVAGRCTMNVAVEEMDCVGSGVHG